MRCKYSTIGFFGQGELTKAIVMERILSRRIKLSLLPSRVWYGFGRLGCLIVVLREFKSIRFVTDSKPIGSHNSCYHRRIS